MQASLVSQSLSREFTPSRRHLAGTPALGGFDRSRADLHGSASDQSQLLAHMLASTPQGVTSVTGMHPSASMPHLRAPPSSAGELAISRMTFPLTFP